MLWPSQSSTASGGKDGKRSFLEVGGELSNPMQKKAFCCFLLFVLFGDRVLLRSIGWSGFHFAGPASNTYMLIILAQSPEYWDYRHARPNPELFCVCNRNYVTPLGLARQLVPSSAVLQCSPLLVALVDISSYD